MFGTALTELLGAVAPEGEQTEVAAPVSPPVMPQPNRVAAMILPVTDNSLPRSEAAAQPSAAAQSAAAPSQAEPLREAESVVIPAEVLVASSVEEKIEEKEENRDEDPEAPIAPALPLPMLVEEQRVVNAAAPVDAPKFLPESNNKLEDKQVKPAPVAPLSQSEMQVPKRQPQSAVRRTEAQPAANPADGQRNEAAPRGDISVESDEPSREQPIADLASFKAKGSEPTEDRVTLRFRESVVPKQDLADTPAETAKPVAPASDPEAESNNRVPDSAIAPNAAAMPEISSSIPPVAHRMETRGTEIAHRPEAFAADKPQALPSEQRLQPRVSTSTTATILDKQASGAVRTVSIRLPIEDGSRAGSAVQIDVARKNSVLEVRLTGTSDGLQRAVTESIDSLVQKLAVDRWSLDAPASPDRSTDAVGIPRMESMLPESGESSARPNLRMPSQEIASAAREMALEAPAQSTSGQQSSDSQRNQDFQQDSGAREHPQQQQEEQRRPRPEAWGQFLQAAEESFEAGLIETAPELQ